MEWLSNVCQNCGQAIAEYWFHILTGALSTGLIYFLGRLLYKYLHYRWMQVKDFMVSFASLPNIMAEHSKELKAHELSMKNSERRINAKIRDVNAGMHVISNNQSRLEGQVNTLMAVLIAPKQTETTPPTTPPKT